MTEADFHGGDLSRRQREFHLNGLSFREYLIMEGGVEPAALSLEEILANHQDVALELTSDMKILPLWEKYFKSGYYPFYRKYAGGWTRIANRDSRY